MKLTGEPSVMRDRGFLIFGDKAELGECAPDVEDYTIESGLIVKLLHMAIIYSNSVNQNLPNTSKIILLNQIPRSLSFTQPVFDWRVVVMDQFGDWTHPKHIQNSLLYQQHPDSVGANVHAAIRTGLQIELASPEFTK